MTHKVQLLERQLKFKSGAHLWSGCLIISYIHKKWQLRPEKDGGAGKTRAEIGQQHDAQNAQGAFSRTLVEAQSRGGAFVQSSFLTLAS